MDIIIDPITRARAAEAGLEAAESHPDPFLACFPLKIDWQNTLPVLTAEPFPAPVHSSRTSEAVDAWTRGAPASVLKLAEFAREHSWEVRTQYSRGCMPHATTGRPGALKDLIGLRFGAHPMTERQAYAVYSRNASGGTWTWSSVMIWGPDLPPYGGCGTAELKDYLTHVTMPVTEIDQWVKRIRSMRAEQAAAVKARPKAPAKPKEVG